MVGIVTFDDAMDVIEEETTEDMALMGAVTPSEKPYFETSTLEHAKNRIVWLLVLMISSTFTGMVITRYEDAFAVVPPPCFFHSDADGHWWKLRFSEFHADHPRACTG